MGLYSIMGAYTIVAARDVSNVHKGVPTLANVYYRTGVNAEAAIRTLLDELFNMADHRGYHAWLRKQDVRIISCYQGMYADLKDTKKGTGVEDYTITVALDIEEDHPSVFVTEYAKGTAHGMRGTGFAGNILTAAGRARVSLHMTFVWSPVSWANSRILPERRD
jgi:hypothetical protein